MEEDNKYQPPTLITLVLREDWLWPLIFFFGGYSILSVLGSHALVLLFGWVALICGAWMIVRLYLRVAQKADLYRHGIRAEATITELKDVSKGIDALPMMKLVYEFTAAEDGSVYTGETSALPITNIEHLKEGDTLKIIYDDQDPFVSFWVDEDLSGKIGFFKRILGR